MNTAEKVQALAARVRGRLQRGSKAATPLRAW